jgi:hypothetical protein
MAHSVLPCQSVGRGAPSSASSPRRGGRCSRSRRGRRSAAGLGEVPGPGTACPGHRTWERRRMPSLVIGEPRSQAPRRSAVAYLGSFSTSQPADCDRPLLTKMRRRRMPSAETSSNPTRPWLSEVNPRMAADVLGHGSFRSRSAVSLGVVRMGGVARPVAADFFTLIGPSGRSAAEVVSRYRRRAAGLVTEPCDAGVVGLGAD